MKRKMIAAVAALSATAAAAPVVASAAPPAPKVAAHCVYVGPVYVFNRLVLGVYEVCEPV